MKLKLVAGEIHYAVEPERIYNRACDREKIYSQPENSFVEETLFEYHLYILERPTTLKNNQIKQLSLLSANSVPLKKELIFEISKSKDIRVVLTLNNSKEEGLGMPLPAGVVRVYKADSEGQLQFLWEDKIDHTPKDEEVKVIVGSAFDAKGTRIQTNYKKVSSDSWRGSYEIELKNHKYEAQKIKIVEHSTEIGKLPGALIHLRKHMPLRLNGK